jgi:hypothetical protein
VDRVPKFFFSVICDSYQATDTVGENCPDIATARQEACRTAREVVEAALRRGDIPQGRVEVQDAEHQQVLVIPLSVIAS